MSATAEIHGESVRLRFSAPWDATGHGLFIRAKRLPEAKYAFDRDTDSYTVEAPARFADIVGLQPPALVGDTLPIAEFLFPVQRWIVEKALTAKRYAIWADCGFGKTIMFLEWARHVAAKTGGRVLILSPKQIIPQTCDESRKFYGDAMPLLVLDSREDLARWCKGESQPEAGIAISNYEKMIPGVLDEIRYCAGVVLDESSILKGGGGVIKWNLIKSCRGIEYKLSCTATPAPNDTMEYASQASFLEKLRNEGEILWTYFVRDNKTQQWKVRPHAREAFYRFMSSWSIYIRKGSAYGFEDAHDVPEPQIVEHKLKMTAAQASEYAKFAHRGGDLISNDKLGVTARSKLSQIAKGFIYRKSADPVRLGSEKVRTVGHLITQALTEKRQALVWTVFDEESDILAEAFAGNPEVATLHGGDSQEKRQATLERFRRGEVRCLISKARLLGYGMNFQFCTRMIFSGFDDSFEQFYQAVRRAHRYGSTEQLVVHVPFIPELEQHMWNNLLRKRAQWEADIVQQEDNYVKALK